MEGVAFHKTGDVFFSSSFLSCLYYGKRLLREEKTYSNPRKTIYLLHINLTRLDNAHKCFFLYFGIHININFGCHLINSGELNIFCESHYQISTYQSNISIHRERLEREEKTFDSKFSNNVTRFEMISTSQCLRKLPVLYVSFHFIEFIFCLLFLG